MRRLVVFSFTVLLLSTLVGCSDKSTTPQAAKYVAGTTQLLSVGGPSKDEDPSIVVTRDGRIIIAWFSDRDGNSDIYLSSTGDGINWTTPVRVTYNSGGDFHPTIIQDDHGKFHLTWFRWTALYVGHIIYNSSIDGITWDTTSEVTVTTAPGVDDWEPTMVASPGDTLLITFASVKRHMPDSTSAVYLSKRLPGNTAWESPTLVGPFASSDKHTSLPNIQRVGNTYYIVAVNTDSTQVIPWLSPRSWLTYATSSDGIAWAGSFPITNDSGNVVHLFPAMYEKNASNWSLAWLSTRIGGTPAVYEIPLSQIDSYPSEATTDNMLGDGYSHKIAETPTPGIYIGAWVHGADTALDIYYRIFHF